MVIFVGLGLVYNINEFSDIVLILVVYYVIKIKFNEL